MPSIKNRKRRKRGGGGGETDREQERREWPGTWGARKASMTQLTEMLTNLRRRPILHEATWNMVNPWQWIWCHNPKTSTVTMHLRKEDSLVSISSTFFGEICRYVWKCLVCGYLVIGQLLTTIIFDICSVQEAMFDKHSVWTVNGRCLAQSGHLRPLVYTKCWHTGTQWGH